MNLALNQFVQSTLTPDYPPEHPLRLNDWAGLAFDRNIHENFAPAEVWNALFASHRAKSGQPIAVIAAADLNKGLEPILLPPTFEAVMAFLTEDYRFVKDHYIASQKLDWISRLDQDVTLIAGEISPMGSVVNALGGIENVCAMMEADFGPGPEDSEGLRRYLQNLVAPLRARCTDWR